MTKHTDTPRRDFEAASAKIINLENRIFDLQEENKRIKASENYYRKMYETLKNQNKDKNDELVEKIKEQESIIEALKNKIAHYEAINNHDGSNTGIPTSQTKYNKKKIIPNSRRSTDKKKGGQLGHKKAFLQAPEESEITDIIEYNTEQCPNCGSFDCVKCDEHEDKYEFDVRISVVKKKHIFNYYKCNKCGKVFHLPIPVRYKEQSQYGSGLQAFILSLTNTSNVPMNKIAMLVDGVTNGELKPSEGFIAKLQSRAATNLQSFYEELKKELIKKKLIFWDDTVIMVNTKRECFRFYGDEKIAYYTAHEHKDIASLDDDNVLNLLLEDTKVMHDHNIVNYNDKYLFTNLECNQHLLRDCQKNTDDTSHVWSTNLKNLITSTIKDRNDAIDRNETSFPSSYVKQFFEKLEECLSSGEKENDANSNKYGAQWERTLLSRVKDYREQYFLWIQDFSIPTTNNLSERGLRNIKSHMKISGQFESIKAAVNFAIIKSYIETCRRNNINEYNALLRLCSDNPYTVKEILSISNP